MLTLDDLKQAREWGIAHHSMWKAQIIVNDAVDNGDWNIAWPDGVDEAARPLVQNVYSGALEDKLATASVAVPAVYVPPPPGTTEDRGERLSQKRRRVYQSYWDRSNMGRLRKKTYRDWFHTGAAYLMPWTDWYDVHGVLKDPAERAPYLMQLDPRQAYPLAHDNNDDLIEIVFIRQRRVAELQAEYGEMHAAFAEFAGHRARRGLDPASFLEEVWYFDRTHWGVALGDSMLPSNYSGRAIIPKGIVDVAGGSQLVWATEPTMHKLGRCPVTESKRVTANGAYRGALEDIIPQLGTAQNFMARLLDDLQQNIYAPVVLDNIQDPEKYGPGAVMQGTGEGKASIMRDRPPVNFEGQRVVTDIIGTAHRQAAWPVQRSGTPDASIVSAKGVVALAGAFNSELAWAQQDMERLLSETNRAAAAFDEHHCPGKKRIYGLEGVTSFTETYAPEVLFRGDYRNKVSYGDSTGMDESARMTKYAMLKNVGAISTRSFITKTNASEDPLQEERDIAIENLTSLFYAEILPQQIQQGDLGALKKFVDLIDSDKETVRSAVLATIREMEPPRPVPEPGQPEMPGMPGGAGGDVIQQMRSLASGGIPGQAPGLPAPPTIGADLQNVLPQQQRRLVSETAPGGTAA